MKTLVKYDSLFGNTEKVAKALASGMREQGLEQRMKQYGMKVVKPHVSEIVLGKEGPLKEGTEEQFKQIGTELARIANTY